jgi:cholesterol oxidase
MPGLSTPIGGLKSEYGVVVVGSGYGGAIAAYRLATHARRGAKGDATYSVCLLERGIEREAGDYPSTLAGALHETQADAKAGRIGSRTALFDFRMNRDVSVLVGCGLGGTSLINAAVMLKPKPYVFDDLRWPRRLRTARAFERYFAIAEEALGVGTIPGSVHLDKVAWLKAGAGEPVDGRDRVTAAPLAIAFQTEINKFGVQQQRCVLCGNCVTGCNHSAKNTVATNYLPGAADAGAAIFCGVETRAIEKAADGTWLVHVRLNDTTLGWFGNPEFIIRANMVFLSAGTLGSTEILLRSRDRYGLAVSGTLGRRFSGNGDVIAFGYNARERANGFGYGEFVPRHAAVGPTIAATVDERSDQDRSGIMIQEGAIPGALRFPLRFAAPLMARATHLLADASVDLSFRHILREIDTAIRGVRHGALARTETFLAMAQDDGDGRMRMVDDRLRITWDQVGYQKVYREISQRLQQITTTMKGRYVINPFWSRLFGRRLVTVHPLGGCCIGDSAATAVVNANGEVFDAADPAGERAHQGLYVCDGSIIPMPLGTNPSLTISALAERITRRAQHDPVLRAAPRATPTTKRIVRSIPGIQYAERMRGIVRLQEGRTRFEVVLHISAASVDELIHDTNHTARVIGVALTPDLAPDRRHWTISDGTLNVLIDDVRSVDTSLLMYRLTLLAPDGTQVWLRGHKTVSLATLRRHPWRTLTRVPFVVFNPTSDRAPDCTRLDIAERVDEWDRSRDAVDFLARDDIRAAGIVGAGAVRGSVADTIRLAFSMRVVHERNPLARLQWRWRYLWYFLNTVIQRRVWAFRTTRAINPYDVEELRRFCITPGTLGAPIEDTLPERADSPRFRLTKYLGVVKREATRGPVMLAPGFGMSTLAFHSAGADSFAEYLHREGYEVWFFDYRASDKLRASLEQFDVDELARRDFGDAIDLLYDKAGGQRVRVVAHCLASMTMQMGLLAGAIRTAKVRSMVLSQAHAFIDLPWPTRLKVRLHLPELLTYLNFRPVVTSDFDIQADWGTRLLDRLLYFFPSDERCYEGVCRRLLLLYGEVVRHDKLDQKTHETFYHLFDRGNLAAFTHIGRMFIRGRIADKHGKNAYLRPEHGRHLNIPITLLQGTANGMFLPSGARKTHAWFVEHGGFGSPDKNREKFTLLETPGYGHLDTFLGRNAKTEVFPAIVAALEAMG